MRDLHPLHLRVRSSPAVLLLVAIIAAIALTLRPRRTSKHQDRPTSVRAPATTACAWSKMTRSRAERRLGPNAAASRRNQARRPSPRAHLSHTTSSARRDPVRHQRSIGIFLNRKNLIVLLMAIELMLLAVNMNFVAFSHYLPMPATLAGQVFVFFILTVAAAESAIGLAILVVLFRNLDTINVDDTR